MNFNHFKLFGSSQTLSFCFMKLLAFSVLLLYLFQVIHCRGYLKIKQHNVGGDLPGTVNQN